MKTIDFEIIYAKNTDIYQTGYVLIPDNEEEEVEWIYITSMGFEQFREYTHNSNIYPDDTDKFKEEIHMNYPDWVQEVIIFSEEDEHATYTKDDLIIHINEGDEWWEQKEY